MKQLLKNIKKSLLVKVASLNSLSVLVRLFAGFLTSKAVAVFIGAEGLALLGNFRNFLTPIQSISTLGIYSGVVKYVSEYKTKAFRLSKTLSSVLYLVVIATFIVSVSCYFLAEQLSQLIFLDSSNYAFVFKIVAIGLPFYAMQALVISINNGMSQFKAVITMTIIGQILVTVITLLMIWNYGLKGALIATAIGEATVFIVTLFWIYRDKAFFKIIKFRKVSSVSLKNLSSFSLMALFSGIIIPLVSLNIRNYIIENESAFDAGMWEAMNRISSYYLMFVTSLMSLYILPRFSVISTDLGFRKEVFSFYKTIIPIFAIGLVIIYLLRYSIITLVLTDEFIPVTALFKWQTLGDFVRVLSAVIAYQFLAKKMVGYYLLSELLSSISLYLLSVYFIDLYGVEGANMAHFAKLLFIFYEFADNF